MTALADKLERWDINRLMPYARNARLHSDEQIAQIAASIREFGFANPILAGSDGVIVAGHGRLAAARRLGLSEVPVVVLDHLTPTQRRALVIADNRLAESATWDEELLAIELDDLRLEDFDLDLLGFSADELDDLLRGEETTTEGQTDDDDVPDELVVPITQPGDIWILGKHRLMCGDSADKESVDRLMNGKLASLVVTDPPYGVSYADKNEFLNSISRGKRNQTPIENDHGSLDEMSALWFETYSRMRDVMLPGAVLYSFGPQGGELMMMMMMMRDAGIIPRHTLIWAKNNHVLGRCDYSYKHEPILYGWNKGGHKFYGDFQTSLLEFPKPQKSDLHPTMKPVALVERLIRNSSKEAEYLFEPFSGSGTTIIASEKTNRRCYAMELVPQYVDVAVNRWQQFTGKTAILEETGKPFPS